MFLMKSKVTDICIFGALLFACISVVNNKPIHHSPEDAQKNRQRRDLSTSQIQISGNLHHSYDAGNDIDDDRTSQDNADGELSSVSVTLNNGDIDNFQMKLFQRLGIEIKDIKPIDPRNVDIPSYILTLYDRMLELDDDVSLRTDGRSSGRNSATLASINVYRSSPGEGQSYRFNISNLAGSDSHITRSELVLDGVSALHSPINVTYTSSYHQTDQILTPRTRTTENAAILDITDIVLHQDIINSENISFRIDSVTGESINPMIAVYKDVDVNRLFSNSQRTKRNSDNWLTRLNRRYGTNIVRNESTVQTAASLNICRSVPWEINFDVIGWNKWLVAPRRYSANLCVGNCPPLFIEPYLNASNYAFVKNLYHVLTNYTNTDVVPKACCSPLTYAPQSVLYQNKFSQIVLRSIQDMRVISCGCR